MGKVIRGRYAILPTFSKTVKEVSIVPEDELLLPLILRIKAGEEAAIEALYNLTVNRVYGLAIKIVTKPELAEEVVGDVFLQVWNKAGSFNSDRAKPIAWLLMICRSRALDKLRREKSANKNQYPESEQNNIEDSLAVTPLEEFEGVELSSRVYIALKILNDKQRQMIVLSFYKGMSHQEISDYTHEPLGTVKSNLSRAQDILRKTLSHEHLNKGGVYGEA